MTFEEIFKKDGRYTSDGFAEGFCFEINKGTLYCIQYKDKEDLFPDRWIYPINANAFRKNYKQVLTRQSLFKK